MIPISGLAHIGVRVKSFTDSIAFYQQLGFEVIREDYEERVVVLKHSQGIELNLLDSVNIDGDAHNVLMDERHRYTGYTHIALGVDDVGYAERGIRSLGICITEGPVNFGDGSTSIFFRDPDRNVIELSQPSSLNHGQRED